ncbi:MAG: serine hydrolase [Gaiellaceae bacterium]
MIRVSGLLIVVALATAAPALSARADRSVLAAMRVQLPAAERASAVGLGSPVFTQQQYDAARVLEGALPPLERVSRSCRPLARALAGYAAGLVTAAEGVDRLDGGRIAAGQARAASAGRRLDALGRTCRPGREPPASARFEAITSPRGGAVFYGDVVAVNHGDEARFYVNGARVAAVASKAPVVRFRLARSPSWYRLEVRFVRDGRPVGRSRARIAYLLPPSARVARPVTGGDEAFARDLAGLGASFGGYAGIYVHDLRTGRAAGWNASARFPAASTVKLGVLVAALARWRSERDDLRLDAELRALTGWSSNLATNRLVRMLGGGSEAAGARAVEAALRRMGATRSTYPQGYRVGTAAGGEPPLVSGRVTTARDLARVLREIAASAAGNRASQRRTGLGPERARYTLGLLLSWEARGDNVGLFAGALPRGTPVAQKNGWISDSRHTAAIVFGRRGPVVAVLLTYRPGLSFAEAAALGRRLVRAAF